MTPDQQADRRRQIGSSNVERDTAASARDRLDQKLDEALEGTFPASDAFGLIVDEGPSRAGDALATVNEDPNSRAAYASPPCFMHELDPSYLGLQPADGARPAGATGSNVPDE
jgi:hypothetical protein